MTENTSSRRQRAFDILLIESEPDDITPFVEAFETTETTESVYVVADGESALDFLHQRHGYRDAPRPDLILLDLHISGPDGQEILAELNERSELRRIPVIVVTESDSAEHVAQSYDLNANAFVHKPGRSTEFEELAEAIERFWLRAVHLPPK